LIALDFNLATARKVQQIVSQEGSSSSVKLPELTKKRYGLLTEKQSQILHLRACGFTQTEIARQLKMSRASVSMIEGRAKRQVNRARQTVQFFETIQKQYEVEIDPGARLQQIPMIVLQEADKYGIHLRCNMVEILRMVKRLKANCLGPEGRLTEKIVFRFNERGKISLV
jgi:HTH-type transcriptional regulator, fmd operon transcriptional regulator